MSARQLAISFLLIFVLVFSMMKNSLMLSFYLIDTEDFVELFCENKEKPEMKCNGKCELSKLAKEDNQPSKTSSILDSLQNELVYYASSFTCNFDLLLKEEKHQFGYQNLYSYSYSQSITHPPVLI